MVVAGGAQYGNDERTLEVALEKRLGRRAVLQPLETELVLNVVDHLHLVLAGVLLGILSGGVGTLKLDVIATDALAVLAAVALPENGVVRVGLKVEGVGDKLVTGESVLIDMVRFNS